jgi:hypothetical protein
MDDLSHLVERGIFLIISHIRIYQIIQCDYHYKMKSRILFLWIFISANLGFTSLVVFENNDTFYWLAYGFAILFVLIFSLVFTFVMVAYFKVRLNNEGVKGFNVFVYRVVCINHILKIGKLKLILLKSSCHFGMVG